MIPKPLGITRIPGIRKPRSDTEFKRFLANDREEFMRSASLWVRQTTRDAEREILDAGNPLDRVTEVNGVNGKGFHAGAITDAKNSARIQWIGSGLASLANRMTQTLVQVIWQTYPGMRRKRLTRWSWYAFPNGVLADKSASMASAPRRLGQSVPSSIGLYDVLFLVPDEAAAEFAWFANQQAVKSRGHSFNMFSRKRKGKMEFKVRKRMRGFLSEAARRMRSSARGDMPGVTIQGMIIERGLTAGMSRATRVGKLSHALPVIRLAYKRGLKHSVTN